MFQGYDTQKATMKIAGIPVEEVEDEISSELGRRYCLYIIDPLIEIKKEGKFLACSAEETMTPKGQEIKACLEDLQITMQEYENDVWKLEDPERLISFQKEDKGFFERTWKIIFYGRCIGRIKEDGPIYKFYTQITIDWTEYKRISGK